MKLETLIKLINKLEEKQEDRYEDEDSYNFVVTTPKALYKVDVVVDRGELMNVSIDVYATDNEIWDHRLLWIQWDLNWNCVIVHPKCERGNKLLNAILSRL